MIRLAAAMFCAALLTVLSGYGGCNGAKEESAPSAKASSPEPVKKIASMPETGFVPTITAKIRTASLEGKPLAGMIPIVTRQPNAFDQPVWTGDPTNEAGQAVFDFPATEKFCLRAWDPALNYFPNNYFDVEPSAEDADVEAEIQMVRSAAFGMMLLNADRTPVSEKIARMMMIHPARGEWWPMQAKTNAEGAVLFEKVPPGKFTVQIETDVGRIRMDEVTLMPGAAADLGAVTLEPLR